VLEDILLLIEDYGYIALFGLLAVGIVGIPIPDEILMTTVGTLTVDGGRLTFVNSLIASFAGTMVGMIVSYYLGNTVGKPFLYRYGKWVKLTPQRLDLVEGWYKKYGLWTVVFGYYVPGVRHFTCYLAGVSGVSIWRYLLFAASGAMVWCLTFLTLGHVIGLNAPKIMGVIHHYIGIGGIIAVAVIGLSLLIYRRVRKNKSLKLK